MSYFAVGSHNKKRGIPKPAPALPAGGPGIYEGAVEGLTPAIYLQFSETSGTVLADSSGNSRTGTLNGSGATLAVTALAGEVGATNKAINLGAAAWISIPHSTADTALTAPSVSQWAASFSTDGFRFIGDTTISCWFKINALPTGSNKAVIFAKSHTATPGDAASYAETTPILANRGDTVNGGSWAAYFDANGAVHVDMRSFRGRPCLIRTPNSAVTTNTTYHLVVQLSYDGVTAWLNGAKFEDGYANALHVYGLCANIRGAVFRNNYAWTIGKAAWGGQSNIIVDEFAVFHRAPSATISQANVNTLAQQGSTPTALAHYIWGASSQVASGSAANIQSAIDARSAAGGGTVLVTPGSYTGNLVLKSNVRVKANGGTVNIAGTCTCPSPTISTLTDNASNFMTGDKTLDITNTRAAGDIVVVMATQGNPSPMRVARRYISDPNNDNDNNGPDSEFFEIESRTGSEITFVGVGSTFDFATANRSFVKAATPIRDVALEGDLRFSANPGGSSVIDLRYVNRARVIGVRGTNLNTALSAFAGFAVRTMDGARSCQFRNVTVAQADMQIGMGSNDGLSFYNGSIDCVGINCTVTEGRHAADVASNGNVGTSGRCDFINITWINNVSRDTGGALSAFGVHGATFDTIYWHCFSNWGGTAATGWKHDSRWHVCGETANAGGGIHLEDGGGDSTYRDIHIIRPQIWFAVFEGPSDVQRCHFENITRSANPTAGVHQNIYGTGANVNTYRSVTAPGPGWQEV